MDSWRELPGPRGWFVWFIAFSTIICMPFWLGGGLPKMLGEFTNWVIGYPHPTEIQDYVLFGRLWGTLYIAVAILFTWLKSYRFLERLQTTIVALLLFCMGLAAIFSHPDLVQLALGTFIPTAPRYQPWLLEKFPDFHMRNPWVEMVVYMGAIGGGTQDYIGYVGLLRKKAWGMMGAYKEAPARISETAGKSAAGAGLAAGATDRCHCFLRLYPGFYSLFCGSGRHHPSSQPGGAQRI